MRFTVFGLGEAGSLIAADLVAAGQQVRGFDPADVTTPAGVERCDDPQTAVAEAGVVLALTASADAADGPVPGARRDPGFGDLRRLCRPARRWRSGVSPNSAAARDLAFADVALMSIVPGNGLRTPALASGSGAAAFEAVLAPLGMPVEAVGEQAGDAATRKLLRSVVIKGLAALLIEAMHAADAAGFAAETWQNLVDQFTVRRREVPPADGRGNRSARGAPAPRDGGRGRAPHRPRRRPPDDPLHRREPPPGPDRRAPKAALTPQVSQ